MVNSASREETLRFAVSRTHCRCSFLLASGDLPHSWSIKCAARTHRQRGAVPHGGVLSTYRWLYWRDEFDTWVEFDIDIDVFCNRSVSTFQRNLLPPFIYGAVLGDKKVPCTLVWPYVYIEGTGTCCDYFIWCVSFTVVILTCVVMCGCVYVLVL